MRFLFILFLIPSFFCCGQKCFEYHLEHCKLTSRFNYSVNSASRSFLMTSGDTRNIEFEIQQGKDYRISICSDEVFQNIIKLVIIKEDKSEIYNNELNRLEQSVEFSVKQTQPVTVLIETPSPSIGISDTVFHEGCVGIIIQEMVTIKTGF